VLPELGEDSPQRMGMHNGLHGSIGSENQQPGGVGTTSNISEPFERGTVTPVEIFQHEHQWSLSREGVQGFGQLARHPRLGSGAHPTLERLPFGGG
jgi:hypothetical protein